MPCVGRCTRVREGSGFTASLGASPISILKGSCFTVVTVLRDQPQGQLLSTHLISVA